MPKSAPTAPELLARSNGADFVRELQTFADTLPRLDGTHTGCCRTRPSVNCRASVGAC